jgi:hypothetical protein
MVNDITKEEIRKDVMVFPNVLFERGNRRYTQYKRRPLCGRL